MLWDLVPMKQQIEELCEIMARTYNCLTMTVQGMQQPVVMQGAVGGEINIIESRQAIAGGKLRINTLDKTGIQASVLDLGGKDHTQNLISTINALDCIILSKMGIKSPGTEKASGITTEETLSINQELQLINNRDYKNRLRWLNNPIIKKKFPKLTIKPAPGLVVTEDYNDRNPVEAT